MTAALDKISWPVSRLGEALEAIGQETGLTTQGFKGEALPAELAGQGNEKLDAWIQATASSLGFEAEPVEAPYTEAEQLVSGAGPTLLRLDRDSEPRFLVLLGRVRGQLSALAPDRSRNRLAPELVRSALCRRAEASVMRTVERVVNDAGIVPRRRGRTRLALLRELLGSTRIQAGWMLRSSPAAPLSTQARELRLRRLFGVLLGAHTIYYGLWILSWWLLGRMALEGRLDLGWLLAWGLILLTLIPFRILVTRTGGLLAIRASTLIKRRLLFGALKLHPDQTRHLGVGHLLGRVVESEVLDAMALTGGFFSLTATIELILAVFVLGSGAGGAGHVLLLVGSIVGALLLGLHHYRCRRMWTSQRFGMTNDLVERMVGHRTRLAQEPREHWNDEEDQELEQYFGLSLKLDRTAERLKVLIPRGWFIAGLLGLSPAFVYGEPSAAALGIAIGGILIAYRAFRNLAEGLERLAAAAIAWERTGLFWKAAAREEPAAQPDYAVASVPASGRRSDGEPLLEARQVVFRYPERDGAVLGGVDLKVFAGDQLLLEGRSGGGKTTLGALLAAMRAPESGLLLLEGLDRQTLGETGWRRRVVMAPQFHENHVLMGTFAFNLLMGRSWPPRKEDLEEAEGVCRALGLGPLLERMPAGLAQIVGETGWQLSHGERSRLYIARALLQGADVLILDESFAALDPETLRRTLGFVLDRAPTVLVIAHP